jgi:hypothetical protein
LVYFAAGNEQNNYLADSLFDPAATENRGEKKIYNMSWEGHLFIVTGQNFNRWMALYGPCKSYPYSVVLFACKFLTDGLWLLIMSKQ